MNEHVFGEVYASAYDILYQDKDYEAECDFLEQIFARHPACYVQSPISTTVLDLGCGTGGHVLPLTERGYTVTGVDRSEAMLLEAHRKAVTQEAVSCNFVQGDIRILELGCTFDAVIAMFAVISYQITNKDLTATFRTTRRHLKPGGLFVFDCWFGPAVLAEKPVYRNKVGRRGNRCVVRYASPTLNILQHTVQVNYKMLRQKDSQQLDETDESHLMRFLFPKEIEHYLSEAGFELRRLCPFMELDREATEHDWNITVVGRAI